MNILLINNLYGADSVGGAEEVVRTRSGRFLKKGNGVFVISSGKQQLTNNNKQGGIETYVVVPKNLCWYKELTGHPFLYRLVWHVRNIFDVRTAKEIVQFCKEHAIDRVETHNLIGVSMQVPKLLRKAGIEHHHYLHDVQLVEPSGILAADHTKDSIAQRVYSACMIWLFGSPAVVYSPTEFLKDFYSSRGYFRGSDWRVEHEEVTKVQSNKEVAPIRTKDTKYLFVGTLTRHKGVLELLDAWKGRVIDTERKSTLTVVGDGVLRSVIEEASTDDDTLDYLGRVAHSDLDGVYAAHDVLVFPSQCIENRPNVIAEAMAYGLEILAVRTGGVPEMVEGYTQSVILVDADDVHSFFCSSALFVRT